MAPFTAKLVKDQEGALTWATASIEESTRDRLIALIADCGEDGIGVTEAASDLDVGHWEISRLRKRLEADSVIQYGGRGTKMVIAANWRAKK